MQTCVLVIIIYLTAVNIAGLAVCGADKRAAIKHRWRVRESVLFGIALIGGSAGVYFAMLIFSHKTKKLKFAVLMPFILLVQAAFLCWLFLH